MASLAQAPQRTNHSAPRVAPIRVQYAARGRRAVDVANPSSLTRELLLLAVDRFEDARRFADLAESRAAALAHVAGSASWEALTRRANAEVDHAEEALAYLIADLFNELAPPRLRITAAEEAEHARVVGGWEAYLRRGIEVGGIAYVVRFDPGNMRGGIIARTPADRVETV